MKLAFFGATGEVTGSDYLLSEANSGGLLIDLGMFQGGLAEARLNPEPLRFDVFGLKGVILTHAHLDHCGRLPLLYKAGYRGPIYMTPATRALTEITLLDSAKVASESLEAAPLYSEEDVIQTLALVKPYEYHHQFGAGSFKVILRDAGHILGSASVEVAMPDGRTIIFSGDLGNSPQNLEKPTEAISKAELVIMESTYGDKNHPEEDTDGLIASEVNEVEKNGGTLLIPAFSVERTQELLHRIDHLKKINKIKNETEVFLDSPMAAKATEVYKHFENLLNAEVSMHPIADDPFEFPGLVTVHEAWQSKKIKDENRPKVIIAGSGMMSGGRILHHAIDFLPLPTTRLFLVGYQAEGTLGRKILDGERKVMIMEQEIEIKATVTVSKAMSAHADQTKLMNWLSKIDSVKRVFLTHGEEIPRLVLAEKIRRDLAMEKVELPKMGEEFEL